MDINGKQTGKYSFNTILRSNYSVSIVTILSIRGSPSITIFKQYHRSDASTVDTETQQQHCYQHVVLFVRYFLPPWTVPTCSCFEQYTDVSPLPPIQENIRTWAQNAFA